jgi:hypothetical protein
MPRFKKLQGGNAQKNSGGGISPAANWGVL